MTVMYPMAYTNTLLQRSLISRVLGVNLKRIGNFNYSNQRDFQIA